MGLLGRGRSWLYWKWLWLCHVYPFYWAHHPLCNRFRCDVVRIGRLHLCRSCLMAYAGFALGVVLCVCFRELLRGVAPLLFASLAGVTLTFSAPVWYKRCSRPMRDVVRGMMGGVIALCGYLLLSGSPLPGLIGAVALIVFRKAYLALRRRSRLKACTGCLHLRGDEICPGFALQAERLRQYDQRATDLLVAGGYVPRADDASTTFG